MNHLSRGNLSSNRKNIFLRAVFFSVIIAGLLLFLGYQYYLSLVYSSHKAYDKSEYGFEIQKGESLSEIAGSLEQADLINSAAVFKLYVYSQGKHRSIQAGHFFISPSFDIPTVVDVLAHAQKREIKLTIPEGYTITQIDQLLTGKSLIQEGEFIACSKKCDFSDFKFLPDREKTLEGYLFPNTYFVFKDNFSSEQLIKKMIHQFQDQFEVLEKDIRSSEFSLDEIVNMASMIEKESNTNSEKNIIAGILFKRLKEGIPLGVDATTRYDLDKWDKPLSRQDFTIQNSYNTRRKLGLPKTPISNPGLSSIKAAVYPEKSPYYYYLHDNTGQIHYARTLEEHNQNKWQYLR